MNKLFILMLTCGCITASAQDGFYLQPEFGLGKSVANIQHPYSIYFAAWGSGWTVPVKSVITFNPRVSAGYRYHNWNFTFGLSYTKSGFTEDSAWTSPGGAIGFTYKETMYYYHIMVPVTAGYTFPLGSHFFCNPAIGGEFAYNTSARIIRGNYYPTIETVEPDHTLTSSEFNNNYKRTGFWGLARVQFGYKANDRLSIIAGPEVQTMFTSILKDNNNSQKSTNYTFSAGITWILKNHKKAEDKPAK